jgi:hypothetical protein
MKHRALQNRLIKKAGKWAIKQVLTSLPIVGLFFKAVFFAIEIVDEIRQHQLTIA